MRKTKTMIACLIIMLIILSTFANGSDIRIIDDNEDIISSIGSLEEDISDSSKGSNDLEEEEIPLNSPSSDVIEASTSNSDGGLGAVDTNYDDVHDASEAHPDFVDYSDYNFTVGQFVVDLPDSWGYDYYSIVRGFVYFDTSLIPSDATISSATLKLYCYAKRCDDNDYSVVIQNGQPDHSL